MFHCIFFFGDFKPPLFAFLFSKQHDFHCALLYRTVSEVQISSNTDVLDEICTSETVRIVVSNSLGGANLIQHACSTDSLLSL